MTIFKDWFIFLGSAITILCNIALPFTYELDKPTIKIGETTTLTVRLPLAKDGSVPQLFEDLVVDHPDLKLFHLSIFKVCLSCKLVIILNGLCIEDNFINTIFMDSFLM